MKDGFRVASGSNNGPAFPNEQHECQDGTWNQTFDSGMSLRDWFAGQALHGIAHYQRHQGIPYPDVSQEILKPAAELACQFADAMLAELGNLHD